jgi:Protein of unknown function with PCYCGC motif
VSAVKRALAFGALGAVALATAACWLVYRERVTEAQVSPPVCIGGHCSGRAEAIASDTTPARLTLDPDQFEGPVKEAYRFAGKDPDLLSKLHCYCGCDRALGHRNLLDCYRGTHGATCEICIGEALMAEQLSRQGSPVDQIRDALRTNFSRQN